MPGMRSIPASFAAEEVTAIDARLDAVVRDEHVTIPLAIESGSRAWGFASPDSDYDCRFLYLRRRRDYLALWPPRDVIETPLDGLLDVNGWDVAKALRLILKGNAVVIEWLRSPIAYRGDAGFRDALDTFAETIAPRGLIARHYLHLGEQQWTRHGGDGEMPGKKLFYALRPAAALRWMRRNEGRLPPMNFHQLLAESDPPADVAAIVAELIERKARTRELGTAPIPPAIAAFITGEYDLAGAAERGPLPDDDDREAAQAMFLTLLDRFGPGD
jgi:predicted nucleotidyltransferase